ncbi:hypothetical protein EVAR_27025_1 [Eumeta japonica]|uniref:Reverse transcriptase domain-containing protein n=1 Tax=Eumeta variegata TaxID=151549 RepID=A0A4C1WE36_EUMVA|nr:hypothetical protein EVAR_27025_1 [Eumeta japonica]
MDTALNEQALSVEMVKSVGSYDQLDEAKEAYEKAVAKVQKASLKRFCSTHERESLWNRIYRETGKNWEDVLLETGSERVLGLDESASLLAETFCPDKRVDTGDPYYMEALAIDGFMSDICRTAIFWYLRLSLAIANKCLELEYFLWAWKVAYIKIILIVSLDIEGDFDNAWLPALMTQLLAYKCSNLILDSFLRELWELGTYVQAFVDDVIIFSGQSALLVEEEANRAFAHSLHSLGIRNKLKFALPKTNSMVLTRKLKYNDPVGHINGYASVIELIKLYASCAWAPTRRKFGVRKMLDAVQRSVALKACRTHRTISLHSTLMLWKLLPLDIRSADKSVNFGDLPHPAYVLDIGYESVDDLEFQTMDLLTVVGPHIYTDGSHIEGKVGAVLTEWRDGKET